MGRVRAAVALILLTLSFEAFALPSIVAPTRLLESIRDRRVRLNKYRPPRDRKSRQDVYSLIGPIEKGWVFPNGKRQGDEGNGLVGDLAGGSPLGNGNSNGSANGKGGNSVGFGYDQNAPKSDAAPNSPPKNAGPNDNPKQPPPPPSEPPQALPKWWPVCIFIDPRIPNGNAIVKGMVDMSAKCGVALEVRALTAKEGTFVPTSSGSINSVQTASCNIPDGFHVPEGSTMFAVPEDKTADEMCASYDEKGLTSSVAGCAAVRSGGGFDPKKATGSEHMKTGTGVLPSIIDNQGLSASVGAHEAIGHSQMGWPNGSTAGLGIGGPGDPSDSEGGSMGGWTGVGCAQQFKMAYGNDGSHRYDPNRKIYYTTHPPGQRWEMGKPLWGKQPPGGPPGGRPPTPPPIAQGPNGPPTVINMEEGNRNTPPPTPPMPTTKNDGISGGHKKLSTAAPTSAVGRGGTFTPAPIAPPPSSGNTMETNLETPVVTGNFRLTPPAVEPRSTGGYGYDSTAVKTDATGNVSSSDSVRSVSVSIGQSFETVGGTEGSSGSSKDKEGAGGGDGFGRSISSTTAGSSQDDFFNSFDKRTKKKIKPLKRGEALRKSKRQLVYQGDAN